MSEGEKEDRVRFWVRCRNWSRSLILLALVVGLGSTSLR